MPPDPAPPTPRPEKPYPPHHDRPRLGILLFSASVFVFITTASIIKGLGDRYSIFQLIFFRSLFAFPSLLFFLFWSDPQHLGRKFVRMLHTRRPGRHAFRVLVGLIAMFLTFTSLVLLPLPMNTALGFTAPLMMAALAGPLLGERVGLRRWGAILAGFAGVLIILRPGVGFFDPGALVRLAATFFYALASIQIRELGRTEDPNTIVFYFTLGATLTAALALPSLWVTPTASDFTLMVLTGLLGGLAQGLRTRGYALAPIGLVAPFDYTAMLWSVFYGWLLWDHLPDLATTLGAAIVAGCGLFVVLPGRNKPKKNIGETEKGDHPNSISTDADRR